MESAKNWPLAVTDEKNLLYSHSVVKVFVRIAFSFDTSQAKGIGMLRANALLGAGLLAICVAAGAAGRPKLVSHVEEKPIRLHEHKGRIAAHADLSSALESLIANYVQYGKASNA